MWAETERPHVEYIPTGCIGQVSQERGLRQLYKLRGVELGTRRAAHKDRHE